MRGLSHSQALRLVLESCAARGGACHSERFALATALVGSDDDAERAIGFGLYRENAAIDRRALFTKP